MPRRPPPPFGLALSLVLSLLASLALAGGTGVTWGGTPSPSARDLPTCGYAQRGDLLVYTFTGPFLAPGSGLTVYATYEPVPRGPGDGPTPRLLVWWPTTPESPEGPRGMLLRVAKTLHDERTIAEEIHQLENHHGPTRHRGRDQ